LVLATANRDKANEITEILIAALDGAVELVPRPAHIADVAEDADTLEGNARLKAIALADTTGMPAIADDTGLEVRALGGRPGVRSARYAGEDATYAENVAKLLSELSGLPPAQRAARFRTVAMVRWPDGREVAAEGAVDGWITETPTGESGFGYDPVFVPDEGDTADLAPDARTFAQLSASEKHAISHRGRAFRALAQALRETGLEGG
jgi:XTP/dITP diphosphohydrolase